MCKRVLKTLKMSIWYKYIIVIHGSSCSLSNFGMQGYFITQISGRHAVDGPIGETGAG